MNLHDYFNFEDLINEAERLVLDELGRQLETEVKTGAVDEETVLDMAAYAMNQVRPMYRVNLLGRLYADTLMREHGEEIRSAVRGAIAKILRP